MVMDTLPEEKKPVNDTVITDHEDNSDLKSDARLVRKIDFHLLPWLCLLYGLALIDR